MTGQETYTPLMDDTWECPTCCGYGSWWEHTAGTVWLPRGYLRVCPCCHGTGQLNPDETTVNAGAARD